MGTGLHKQHSFKIVPDKKDSFGHSQWKQQLMIDKAEAIQQRLQLTDLVHLAQNAHQQSLQWRCAAAV